MFQNLDIKLSLLNCLRIYFLSLLGGGPGCSFFTDPRRGGGWEGGGGTKEQDPEPENDSVLDDIFSLSLNFLVPFRKSKYFRERKLWCSNQKQVYYWSIFLFFYLHQDFFTSINWNFIFLYHIFKKIILISDYAKKFQDICLHTKDFKCIYQKCSMCKYFCIVLQLSHL